MRLVMKISSHIVVLNFGRKLSEGSPDQIKDDPAVIEAYLGQDWDKNEGKTLAVD